MNQQTQLNTAENQQKQYQIYVDNQINRIKEHLMQEKYEGMELATTGCIQNESYILQDKPVTFSVFCQSTGKGESLFENEQYRFLIYCIREDMDPYPIFISPLSVERSACPVESEEYVYIEEGQDLEEYGERRGYILVCNRNRVDYLNIETPAEYWKQELQRRASLENYHCVEEDLINNLAIVEIEGVMLGSEIKEVCLIWRDVEGTLQSIGEEVTEQIGSYIATYRKGGVGISSLIWFHPNKYVDIEGYQVKKNEKGIVLDVRTRSKSNEEMGPENCQVTCRRINSKEIEIKGLEPLLIGCGVLESDL